MNDSMTCCREEDFHGRVRFFLDGVEYPASEHLYEVTRCIWWHPDDEDTYRFEFSIPLDIVEKPKTKGAP